MQKQLKKTAKAGTAVTMTATYIVMTVTIAATTTATS
jgi:hypothetical protein